MIGLVTRDNNVAVPRMFSLHCNIKYSKEIETRTRVVAVKCWEREEMEKCLNATNFQLNHFHFGVLKLQILL